MSQPLRFHVLGDSLAAGVGCARADQTPGHLLATALRSAGHDVDLSVALPPPGPSSWPPRYGPRLPPSWTSP